MWCSEIADPDLIRVRPALGRTGEAPLALIPSVDGLDIPVEHAIFTRSEQPVILTSVQGAERLQSRLNRPSRVLSGPTDLRKGLEEVQNHSGRGTGAQHGRAAALPPGLWSGVCIGGGAGLSLAPDQ